MLIVTGHNFVGINSDREIDLPNITALRVVNVGTVPFEICGQIIMPSGSYEMQSDGTVTDFKQHIQFSASSGAKAIIEYKQQKQQQCSN
jgi:hypothetical protein